MTTSVRYYQDAAQTQGPYVIDFEKEDDALAFIESIGTGEVVQPEPVTPEPTPAETPVQSEGDAPAPVEGETAPQA